MSESRSLETLAVAGHSAGFVLHGLFAVWHWIVGGRFDFWAKFNTVLAINCFVSIFIHARRVAREITPRCDRITEEEITTDSGQADFGESLRGVSPHVH